MTIDNTHDGQLFVVTKDGINGHFLFKQGLVKIQLGGGIAVASVDLIFHNVSIVKRKLSFVTCWCAMTHGHCRVPLPHVGDWVKYQRSCSHRRAYRSAHHDWLQIVTESLNSTRGSALIWALPSSSRRCDRCIEVDRFIEDGRMGEQSKNVP